MSGNSGKIPVAVLGATGTVGQKFVRLLADHPWFELAAVAASSSSAGKPYGEAARWRETAALPERIAKMIVSESMPPLPVATPIVFSALDAAVAEPIEQAFAKAGAYVVSNTRTHRMEADVPLMVPEANVEHLPLIQRQRDRGWAGAILTNPNCVAAPLSLALAPLHREFGIEKMFVSTMQAVSGAGYPGVASLDIVGNVIPFINGEEEKVERECRKILGTFANGQVEPASFTVAAHANRVPVIDGHMETVSVGFRNKVTPARALELLQAFRSPPSVAKLPSSPAPAIEVDLRADRPQPRLDLDRGRGMTVTVGRVRECPLLDLRLVILGHNTVRGAAGQAVQIAELLVSEGVVTPA